ncbi:MAG: DAK2 domain-containing protein [Acidimicrobiales bacterium]|nr:DAK2 domain-containing protein [Acidimicrobiales bacterium]
MTTLERLDASDLRHVVIGFRDALRVHQEVINRLNVYPVPDGDTGTNMALTLESVVAELEGAATDMAATCKAIGYGALMGARGNSGVIMSQILRGFTATLAAGDTAGGPEVAEALSTAAKGAYEAVGNPVEGTILTVVRRAAEGAVAAGDAPLVDVLESALAAGREALAQTPDLLPVLAAAGVVDAGGTGLLLLLDAALTRIDGRPMPEVQEAPEPAVVGAESLVPHGGADHDHGGSSLADLRYEVMYLLEAPDETIPAFKEVWAGIGDSIVVVGGEGLFNCHIHTDDIGAAIEAAIEIGRPMKIRVTDLLDEVEEERWVREAAADPEPEPELEPVTTAVVAVATGDGVKRIFRSLGVQNVITGGQSMNPSTAQLLEAVEAAPADEVVILPNNKNIIAVAEQVDATTSKTVRVVPTKGIPEGFAALLAYDPEAGGEQNAAGMSDAAQNVLAGEVTQAVRESTCDAGPIAEGDFIGIDRSSIRSVASSAADAATGLLGHMLDGSQEIVTVIEGEGATPADTRRITEWVAEHHGDVEVEIHHGGQPLYPYLFGIE